MHGGAGVDIFTSSLFILHHFAFTIKSRQLMRADFIIFFCAIYSSYPDFERNFNRTTFFRRRLNCNPTFQNTSFWCSVLKYRIIYFINSINDNTRKIDVIHFCTVKSFIIGCYGIRLVSEGLRPYYSVISFGC